jgi:FAD/FMN-containing dehydrogenase
MEHDELGTRLRTALGAGFTGRCVLPSTRDYDDARRVWNGMVDKRPALIAYCESAADVAAAVRAAQDVGAPLSVRGGGHQVAGLSVADGALTVDLSRMNDVSFSAGELVSRAGGGCLLGHVDSANARHGRLIPAGVVSHTGLGGLALGGGFGWTHRNFGLTCDNIVGAQVVTADGAIVRAAEDGDVDLLWALRGGGGNFGVVTEFELKTYPVADVLFGQAVFTLDQLPAAVGHYVTTIDEVPEQLTAICITSLCPPMPGVPPELVGQPVVCVNAVWSGDLAKGDEPMRRLIESGGPAMAQIHRMPYVAVQAMQDALHPHGRRNYNKSRYLDRVDDSAVKALRAAAETVPTRFSQVEILRLGGAVGRVADDAMAFAHRGAGYILNVVAQWEDIGQTDELISWARQVYAGFDDVGSDAGYVNFIDDEPDRARSVYPPKTYARLQETKRRLDPGAVFRGNVPILPAVS